METDTPSLPGRGIRPLASLLGHRRLAIAAFVVVLLAGIPFAWKKGQSHYSTEATLQVAPRYMRNIKEDQELDFQSNTQYRQFVEQQRKSIGRYDVLRDALARLPDQGKTWRRPGESDRRMIERLRDQLKVEAVPDTYMLQISLEGDTKAGLADVVNAVTVTFMERMKSEQIYGADERTRHLKEREQELLAQIADKDAKRGALAQRLSLTTFHEGTPNPYDKLVSDARTKQADARQRRMDADAALAAFRGRGDTNVVVRSVQEAVLSDPGLNSLKGALATRRAQLLAQKSGLRADHPAAVAADRELAEIDAEVAGQARKLEGGVRGNLLQRLQATVDQAHDVERGIEADLARLEVQATEFARLFQEAMGLTADMAQARSELDKVRERVNFIDVESTSFGFLRLIAPALEPDLPYGAGRTKLLLGVLLAALAAGVLLPIGLDMLDRRVHTVNDAQRLMGIAPAGWQVRRSDVSTQVFGDEQLRRMAAALIRGREARGQNVFGFTGCKPGAGTSSLVLELAGTLRSLGYSVLAVEVNGFSRDARYASGQPGLNDLLHGRATADEVVAEATPALPPRVAVGGHGRTALERIDVLAQTLRHWAGVNDFVLVDMPPLLASADAELLVPVVGQVMLVLDANGVTKGEVLRAKRLLQTIDPQAVGLVVNGIAPFLNGGYLRDLMIESTSGRRAASVFTLSRWRLALATLSLRFKRVHS